MKNQFVFVSEVPLAKKMEVRPCRFTVAGEAFPGSEVFENGELTGKDACCPFFQEPRTSQKHVFPPLHAHGPYYTARD